MSILLAAETCVAISFLIFVGILVYVGVPKLLIDALDKRARRVQAELVEARRLNEEAEKQIAATKTAAMSNVRGIAVDAAAAIVERLIGSAPPAPAVAAAVDDVLKR